MLSLSSSTRSRRRVCALLLVGLFSLTIAVSPLLHHDLACHLKSKTHCTACLSNPSALKHTGSAQAPLGRLVNAGRVEIRNELASQAPTLFGSWGRSPPA